MNVILRQDIPNLGHKDDIVTVNDSSQPFKRPLPECVGFGKTHG